MIPRHNTNIDKLSHLNLNVIVEKLWRVITIKIKLQNKLITMKFNVLYTNTYS